MEKAPDAFRTISEVADDLDVPQHVLRFWETRFPHIKPMKRGGGRRYYRPEDVDLLRGIRHLLYGEGYTIRGVQRLLKDNGVKFVQAVWRGDAAEVGPAEAGAAGTLVPTADGDSALAEAHESLVTAEIREAPLVVHEPPAAEPPSAEPPATEPPTAQPAATEPPAPEPVRVPAARQYGRANVIAAKAIVPADAGEMLAAIAGAAPPLAQPEDPPVVAELVPAASPAALEMSAENRRRLQAALYELAECRRLLEEALKDE